MRSLSEKERSEAEQEICGRVRKSRLKKAMLERSRAIRLGHSML